MYLNKEALQEKFFDDNLHLDYCPAEVHEVLSEIMRIEFAAIVDSIEEEWDDKKAEYESEDFAQHEREHMGLL